VQWPLDGPPDEELLGRLLLFLLERPSR
jgi:hypothetical protein